jgi:hypothetical protein
MLDQGQPISTHVFAAARAEERVLAATRRMTTASREVRIRLQELCVVSFAELRHLHREHFAERSAIPAAIDALEQAIAGLAAAHVLQDRTSNHCPVCTAVLTPLTYTLRIPADLWNAYCGACLEPVVRELRRLRSWKTGFGTDAI